MRDGAMVAVVMTVNVAWNDCRHVGVHWQVLFGFGFEVPVPSGLEISRLGNAYVLVMTGSCAWRVSVLGCSILLDGASRSMVRTTRPDD